MHTRTQHTKHNGNHSHPVIVDDSITFAFFFSSIWTWVFHCNTANTLIISLNTSFHNIYVNYAQMTLMTRNGLPTKCDYIHNFFFAITSLVSNSDFSVANKKKQPPNKYIELTTCFVWETFCCRKAFRLRSSHYKLLLSFRAFNSQIVAKKFSNENSPNK